MGPLALLMFHALIGTASAQSANVPGLTGAAVPLDPTAVEAFVDAAMAESLSKTYAPGVIVTVVQGDRAILAKGYGVANVETRAPIDPARTLFRIASITKVFTTVAALRLEEQGKLDLDADVNRYLTRVKVPDTFPEPITPRRLMTHHGGFDVAVLYMGYDFHTEQAAQETPEQMNWDLVRARPVSTLPLYDNLGPGVLGLVVADILGTSYREAVRQEIFVPLGMDQSVSGIPEDRIADVAHAHMRNAQWQAALIPQSVMATSAQGAGDISSTAVDMGKFLSAMLVPGKLLRPATLARMTNFDTWRFNPRLPGLGLGIMQYFYHGHAAEGHRGEINGFISRLALFRDQDIGIFISVDSSVQVWPQPRLSDILGHLSPPPPPPAGARTLDPDHLIDGFLERFADRFLPAPASPPELGPPATTEPTVEQLAGVYFRRDASTHLLARLLSTIYGMRVEALPGGMFAVDGCRPFIRKGPLYYECSIPREKPITLGFRVEDGNRLFVGEGPVGALERQPWWLTAPFAVWPVPILGLIALSAFFIYPRTRNPADRRVLMLAAMGAALFLVSLILELQFAYDLSHSALRWMRVLWRVFFPLAAAFLLSSAVLAPRAWRMRSAVSTMAAVARISYDVVLLLSCLGLVWLIWLWGLAWPFHAMH